MKVWIVHQNAYTPSGAGSTRHFEFAKRLNARGHRVTIVASSFDHKLRQETVDFGAKQQMRQTIDDVDYLWVRSPAYRNSRIKRLWGMFGFFNACRRLARSGIEKPDVVIGSSPPLLGALGGHHIAKKFDVPFVLEIRDIWPLTLKEFGLSTLNPIYPLFVQMERYLYRTADRIISTLPNAQAHIKKPVTWIPNGSAILSTPWAKPEKHDGPFRVVYAGAHGPSNDIDTIIESAALLHEESLNDIHFHLFGEGSEKQRLMERSSSLSNVTFHPAFKKADVEGMLRSADIFVATVKDKGIYRFGISLNKLSDYCGVGRPIALASNAPSDPVSEASCGIKVAAEDASALAAAISNIASLSHEERVEMGRRARTYAEENFAFDILASRLDRVLYEATRFSRRPSVGEIADSRCDDAVPL